MSQDPSKRVHVVAAVLQDAHGRVLITRRAAHVHQGGLWEFPGGKVEPGEGALQALTRELREELGVALRGARPLIRVPHDYPDRAVLLDVWRVTAHAGVAYAREGQPLEWVAPGDLEARSFPEADRPVLAALRLPARYLITPEPGADTGEFLDRLERRLEAGVRLVQLRATTLDGPNYRHLATQALECCRRHGARLLLNADPPLARELGADGVHLGAGRLMGLSARPLPAGYWVGASCHDAAELRQARRVVADFAVLSPVRPTRSHPGAAPLGWAGFAALVSTAGLPVYALGGMGPADLDRVFRLGGQGVAGIRALWAERDSDAGPDLPEPRSS